jgi:hypothetical protein
VKSNGDHSEGGYKARRYGMTYFETSNDAPVVAEFISAFTAEGRS